MTERASFIINGAERVVVSQLHRSPGVSFNKEVNIQTGKDLYTGKIIPYKGTWLEFETDKNDFLNVKIDRKQKVLSSVFLKAVEFYNSNEEIMDEFLEVKSLNVKEKLIKYNNVEELISKLRTDIEGSFLKDPLVDDETGEILFDTAKVIDEEFVNYVVNHNIEELVYWEVKPEDKVLANSLVHDSTTNSDEAVLEVFKKLRPGDLVTVDSARSLIRQMFFNPQRYDLAQVGRYKMNKRLRIDMPEDEISLTKDDVVQTIRYVIVAKDVEELTYWEVKPEDKVMANALLHDSTTNSDEAVLEVFKKLRPGVS